MRGFGTTQSGENVDAVTISAGELTITILTLGAIIHRVKLDGIPHSLTCNPNSVTDYEGRYCYHGALIGPIVNRINPARMRISGMMYELDRNENGETHLHSGKDGTQHQNWTIVAQSDDHVVLTLPLTDGAAGLPGARNIEVTYSVVSPASLTMTVTGTSDSDTAMSFANHSYWNLDGTADWSGHNLMVNASAFLPVTSKSIPTGEVADVETSDMDFRVLTEIQVGENHIDNNFCLTSRQSASDEALTLVGQSGVALHMATTAPGIQVYDGQFNEKPYEGLALEAQLWPNAPNTRGFPSIKLAAGETYSQTTSWRFTR